MKIAVSGINATDNPGPGIAVARSLKEYNPEIKIIGLSYDLNDPGHFISQYIDKSYMLNIPSHGWPGIFQKLIKIKEEYGLDMVIPCLDAELPLFIKHRSDLEEIGIKTFLPSEAQFELRDKAQLSTLAESIGLQYPQTYLVNTHQEIDNVIEEERLTFPLVVKGKYYKAYIVHNELECKHRFDEIAVEWGTPILIQKCVEGEEFNLVGVGDGEGGDLGLFSIKKLTTTSIGKIWTGVTVRNDDLIKTAKQFIQETKWRGPFELECIFNENDLFMIEINPRFPAWVYFSTGCGLNLLENILKYNLGENIDSQEQPPQGKLFIRYTEEIITNVNDFSKIG
jgi:carbamoyl-phosphate synthase large subunit